MAVHGIGGGSHNINHPDPAVLPFEDFWLFIGQEIHHVLSQRQAAGKVGKAVPCVRFQEGAGSCARIVVIGAVMDHLGILAV